MLFRDIVASGDHSIYLRKSVEDGTLPHALLFWGPPGTGKLSTALALTQYMLCDDRADGEACDKCKACVKTRKFIHPDVMFIFPVTSSKDRCSEKYPEWRAEISKDPHLSLNEWLSALSTQKESKNPQGNIYSAEIANIIDTISLKSFEGRTRIMLVWMAEFLRKEGNKLLKLIEEPPPNTAIILITEDRERILPTIQSRCQHLYYPQFKEETIATLLEQRMGIDYDKALSVAAASGGSWKEATSIVGEARSTPIEQVQEWVKVCWGSDLSRLTEWSNNMGSLSRFEQKHFGEYLLKIWQKLFWHKWGVEHYADPEEYKLVKWLNTRIEFNEFDELRMLFEKTINAVQRNANGKILWMDTSLQFRNALLQKHAALRHSE